MNFSLSNNPFGKKHPKEENDLGFGTKITAPGERLINKDGTFNIVRVGGRSINPYQELVEMSWTRFFLLITTFYCLVNGLFALMFVIIGVDSLSGVEPGGFIENFGQCLLL